VLKVAILPGHGGFDSGAVNPRNKVRECDGTLGVALKLGELLKFNDFEVIYSRTTDIACGGAKTSTQDVTNQVSFVNNSGANIAIAIHYNGSTSASAHGIEVLYSNLMYPNPNEAKLAKLLLNELVLTTGLTNRGLKTPNNISIIKKSKIPCVLSECAFVTNDKESIWCSDENHQWKLAQAHAKSICKYFGKEYIDMEKTTIKLNGKDLSTGYLIQNSNYCPVRALAEALGCTLTWDGNTKTVNIIKK